MLGAGRGRTWRGPGSLGAVGLSPWSPHRCQVSPRGFPTLQHLHLFSKCPYRLQALHWTFRAGQPSVWDQWPVLPQLVHVASVADQPLGPCCFSPHLLQEDDVVANRRASAFVLWAAFFPFLYWDTALAAGGARNAVAVDLVAS
ncbi:hypothetical protein GWK47_013203 [Chionoecetes opilio]|uniref:Uncharacterized protein n=1 Tax=Chionoecetes opilio TaxID=41210 RepID=A0A8J5C1H1_CHIOP|nr:hypothetical protein GWK47_013203 [Chionoecetes opilio]